MTRETKKRRKKKRNNGIISSRDKDAERRIIIRIIIIIIRDVSGHRCAPGLFLAWLGGQAVSDWCQGEV